MTKSRIIWSLSFVFLLAWLIVAICFTAGSLSTLYYPLKTVVKIDKLPFTIASFAAIPFFIYSVLASLYFAYKKVPRNKASSPKRIERLWVYCSIFMAVMAILVHSTITNKIEKAGYTNCVEHQNYIRRRINIVYAKTPELCPKLR